MIKILLEKDLFQQFKKLFFLKEEVRLFSHG